MSLIIYIFVPVRLKFRYNLQVFIIFVHGMLVNTYAEIEILS